MFRLKLLIIFFTPILLQAQNIDYKINDRIIFKEYIPSDSIESTGLAKVNGLAFDKEGRLNWLSQLGYYFTWDITQRKVLKQNYFNTLANGFVFTKRGLIINRGDFLENITIANDKVIIFPILEKDSSVLDLHAFTQTYDGKLSASYTDKEIYVWNFDENTTPMRCRTNDYLFDISFYDNDKIAAITKNGKAQLLNIKSNTLLRELSFSKKRLNKISVSPHSVFTAIVLEDEVKIWNEKWASNIYSFKSNLQDISEVTWLDNQTLILAGENNGIEFWDVKMHKNIQSINIIPKKINQKQIEKDPYLDSNKSSIHISNLTTSTTESNNFVGSISALATTESCNFAISQGFTISSFLFNNGTIKNLLKKDIYDNNLLCIARGENNRMNAMQLSEDARVLFIGSTHSNGVVLLEENKCWTSSGMSKYAQIDYDFLPDISLLKIDRAKWNNYTNAYLAADRNGSGLFEIKNHSKFWSLTSEAQRNPLWRLPYLRDMKNPSGFDVSPSKKYLATFDADGQIQIMNVDEAKMVFDTVLNLPVKKAFFSQNDDLFFINGKNEVITLDFKNKKAIFTKEFDIMQSFEKVESNKANLIALHDSTSIHIYDIEKKEYLRTINNTQANFFIETLKFFPKSDKVVWAENEKQQNTALKKEIELPIVEDYPLITHIAISKDKKTIAFGNTIGDILIYTKTKK